VRGALGFCLAEPGEVAAGAQLACDLWRYWETHGHLTEGRRVLAALLEKLDLAAPIRPRALWVAGFLAMVQGDLPVSRTRLEAGLSAARLAGDSNAEAWALSFLGNVINSLGNAEDGQALVEAALRLHEEAGDQLGTALAVAQAGFIHLCSGEPRMAADLYTRCGHVAERSGNVWYQTYAQWATGVATWMLGDPCGAGAPLRAALSTMRRTDDPIGVALCLDALAWIAASRHETARSLTLLAAADKAWAAIPAPLPSALDVHHEEALRVARKALSAAEYRTAFAQGSAMDQAEAIAFALEESARPRQEASQAGADPGQLTRREQEVAALVAQGMSNSQIAASLVISVRTVETHVQHIMDKLGCSTRAQIAAWSAARSQ
jgi:non-specific serine/threonine protein kinase